MLFVVAIFVLATTLALSPSDRPETVEAAGGWSALSTGANNTVYASAEFNGQYCVGGTFTSPASKVACWNGSTWAGLGTGPGIEVESMAVFNNQLWVGGQWTVKYWDGASWTEAAGIGSYKNVWALAVYNSELYAGRDGGIRKWNGSSWDYVGTNYPTDTVSALYVFGGELYAGGWFTGLNGGGTGNRIAKWNGTTWAMVNYGFDSAVLSLTSYNSQLYAGGYFGNACSNNACSSTTATNELARLNGSSWETAGADPDHGVFAMGVYNNKLYIGGRFTVVNAISNSAHIARYDGAIWDAVGTGISGDNTVYVYTILPFATDIVAAGTFTTAGGTAAARVAKWNDGGITISGNVYTAEDKSTNIGADKTIGLSVNGGTKSTVETTDGGAFSFSDITISAGQTVTLFVDGENGLHANMVSRAVDASTNLTGLELYTDEVMLSHGDSGPLTNANLATAATLGDDDYMFSSDGTNATFNDGYQAEIVSAKTYTPGGTITAHDFYAAGTATLSASDKALTFSGSFKADTGATITSTGIVTFSAASGTETLDTGGTSASHDFQTLTKSGGGTLQLTGHGLTVGGTITISSSTILDANGQDISAATLSNLATLKLNGNETVTITSKDTTHGTVEYNGSGTYTLLPYGNSYNNLVLSGSGNFSPADSFSTAGSFSQTGGTLNLSTHTLTSLGDFTVSGGTFNADSSTVVLDATGQNIALNAPDVTFKNLTVKTGVTIADSRTVTPSGGNYIIGGNFSIVSDVSPVTFNASTNNPNITIYGTLTSSGAGYGQHILAGSGTWTVDGNIDLTDCTFEGNTSNFVFRAENNSTPTIKGNDQTFYNFEVSLAKTYIFSDAFRTSGTFKATTGGATLRFAAGSTYRLAAINIHGQSGSLVAMKSSSTNTRWNFYVSQTSPTVSYVSVKDSNASNKAIDASDGTCTNGGNNLNWTFPASPTPTPAPSPSAASSSTSGSTTINDNSTSSSTSSAAASPTTKTINVPTTSPIPASSAISESKPLVEIPAVIYKNEKVVLQGKATPGATVQVRVDGDTIETTASTDGSWKIELNKEPGTYKAQVVVKNPDGTEQTEEIEIKVLSYTKAALTYRYIAIGISALALIAVLVLIKRKSGKKRKK